MANVNEDAVAFLRRSNDFFNHNRQESLDDLRFSFGDQWQAEMQNARKLEGRPWFVINETDAYIRQIVNQIRQQRPRIKCHGINDASDAKIAEILTGITRHIEEKSDAANAYDTAAEFAIRIGWGYWRLRTEYQADDSFQQEIRIEPIFNPFTVSFDPYSHAPDGADQKESLISEMMSKEEFRILYPDADESNFSLHALGDNTAEWLTKDAIRLAEYYKLEKELKKLVHLSDGTGWWADEMPDIGLLEQAGIKVLGDRDSWRKKVCWYKLTATEVLEERVIPGKYIPVVPVYGANLMIDGKVRRFGVVRMAKDPQRMLNYWQTSITELVALAPKAKWLVGEEQIDGHEREWERANTVAYPVLKYKQFSENGEPLPPPIRQAPEPPPQGAMAAAQLAHDNLQRVLGMFDPAMTAPGQESGKALNAMQQQSDMSNYHFYDNLTRSIKHTGRIILDWVPVYYPKRTVMRIIGDDGKPDMVTINDDQAIGKIENDITVGEYDVVMETGPGYNSKRQETMENMAPLLQGPNNPLMQIAGDLFFRNMDWPGAEVIADRLAAANPLAQIDDKSDIPPRAQMMIKQLQQQLQQAGQQMGQMQLVSKFKADLEGQKDAAEIHKEQIRQAGEDRRAGLADRTYQHDIAMREHGKLGAAEIDGIVKLLLAHKESQIRMVELASSKEEAKLDREKPTGTVQ